MEKHGKKLKTNYQKATPGNVNMQQRNLEKDEQKEVS